MRGEDSASTFKECSLFWRNLRNFDRLPGFARSRGGGGGVGEGWTEGNIHISSSLEYMVGF